MKRILTFGLASVVVLSLCLCSSWVRDSLADIASKYGDDLLNFKRLTITPSSDIGTAATGFLQITSTNADTTVQGYLIKGTYTDDGDADADFLIFEDNAGDTMFLVANSGNVTVAGTLGVTGAQTFTGLLTAAGGIDTVGSTTDITLKNDATIVNTSAALLTITEPTITLAGSTKINLDGPTDVSGILTLDTASASDHLVISAAWGLTTSNCAISIGDYSTPLALGAISDHAIGIVSHYSASIDDASNMIPILGKFTTTGSCASAVVQSVMGQAVVLHDVADAYAVRGSLSIAGSDPEVNQMFGMFSTVTTEDCNLATTGNIAGFATEITGTLDITQTGSYAKVSGLYVAWKEEHAMAVETCGAYIGVFSGAALDVGYRINSVGTLTSAFHSENGGSTPTNVLALVGAHTNLLSLPAEGTAPVASHVASENSTGRIKITVGGADRYIYYYD